MGSGYCVMSLFSVTVVYGATYRQGSSYMAAEAEGVINGKPINLRRGQISNLMHQILLCFCVVCCVLCVCVCVVCVCVRVCVCVCLCVCVCVCVCL